MIYDTVIIGSGPAGISASIYARRNNLKVLILTCENGALMKAKTIDNYYGTPKISGIELYNTGIKQAKDLDVEIKKEEVISLKLEMIDNNMGYKITTTNNSYIARTVVLSTGTSRSLPNIKNIKEYIDTNISYCATCDGFFYRKKDVAVLGYSKYAVAEARELANIVGSVTILTNGLEFNEELPDNIKLNKEKIKSFKGTNKIEQIELENSTININGLFIAWGIAGGYEFAKKIGVETIDNKIIVNNKMETNIPGLYACGDVTGAPYQIYKAVYEGSTVGQNISEYLKKEKTH